MSDSRISASTAARPMLTSVELASPLVSASGIRNTQGFNCEPPCLQVTDQDPVFGTSLQRSRKLSRTDYFASRTPPSPSTCSSDTQTPASDFPLTPLTTSTTFEDNIYDSPSLWPMPPTRKGLGFDLDGGLEHKVTLFKRPPTPYYLAPESLDDDHHFDIPNLGMSLQSQSLVNLSRPTNLEQLRNLRQAASELESAAGLKREELKLEDKRIRRKAVPTVPTDVQSNKMAVTFAQHRLSVVQAPVRDKSEHDLSERDFIPLASNKRPTLASIYRNSRASQSVSELSQRLSALRGSSLRAKISSPVPVAPSETSSISEHSEESMASTSSSFSATYPKDASGRIVISRPSDDLPGLTDSDDASTIEPRTPQTHAATFSLPDVDSGFKKLGIGLSRGMTSVFHLLQTDEKKRSELAATPRKSIWPFRKHRDADRIRFRLRFLRRNT